MKWNDRRRRHRSMTTAATVSERAREKTRYCSRNGMWLIRKNICCSLLFGFVETTTNDDNDQYQILVELLTRAARSHIHTRTDRRTRWVFVCVCVCSAHIGMPIAHCYPITNTLIGRPLSLSMSVLHCHRYASTQVLSLWKTMDSYRIQY